jgi:hypothetical protein
MSLLPLGEGRASVSETGMRATRIELATRPPSPRVRQQPLTSALSQRERGSHTSPFDREIAIHVAFDCKRLHCPFSLWEKAERAKRDRDEGNRHRTRSAPALTPRSPTAAHVRPLPSGEGDKRQILPMAPLPHYSHTLYAQGHCNLLAFALHYLLEWGSSPLKAPIFLLQTAVS